MYVYAYWLRNGIFLLSLTAPYRYFPDVKENCEPGKFISAWAALSIFVLSYQFVSRRVSMNFPYAHSFFDTGKEARTRDRQRHWQSISEIHFHEDLWDSRNFLPALHSRGGLIPVAFPFWLTRYLISRAGAFSIKSRKFKWSKSGKRKQPFNIYSST